MAFSDSDIDMDMEVKSDDEHRRKPRMRRREVPGTPRARGSSIVGTPRMRACSINGRKVVGGRRNSIVSDTSYSKRNSFASPKLQATPGNNPLADKHFNDVETNSSDGPTSVSMRNGEKRVRPIAGFGQNKPVGVPKLNLGIPPSSPCKKPSLGFGDSTGGLVFSPVRTPLSNSSRFSGFVDEQNGSDVDETDICTTSSSGASIDCNGGKNSTTDLMQSLDAIPPTSDLNQPPGPTGGAPPGRPKGTPPGPCFKPAQSKRPPTPSQSDLPPPHSPPHAAPISSADPHKLISEQQAEIEKLRAENKSLAKKLEKAESDMTRMIRQQADVMGRLNREHERDMASPTPRSPRVGRDAEAELIMKLAAKQSEISDLKEMVAHLKEGQQEAREQMARVNELEDKQKEAESRRTSAAAEADAIETKCRDMKERKLSLEQELRDLDAKIKKDRLICRQQSRQLETEDSGTDEAAAEAEAELRRVHTRVVCELTELKSSFAWAESVLDRLGIATPSTWFDTRQPGGVHAKPSAAVMEAAMIRLVNLKTAPLA